jgi:hypothetical protein
MEVSFIAPLYDRPPDFYSKGLFLILDKKNSSKGAFFGKIGNYCRNQKQTRNSLKRFVLEQLQQIQSLI